MRVLVAFDKFKEALSARRACDVAAAALREKHPDWQVETCPLTDGGEGFCEALATTAGAAPETRRVLGPLGAPVDAPLALVPATAIPAEARRQLRLDPGARLGVVGLAEASGLALLHPDERDPWHATTFGTGQLLRTAADAGADMLLLGLGGSATNDLGLGALGALGLGFRLGDGTPVAVPTPATWTEITRIDGAVTLPPLAIACDVTNPLLGTRGATATFGPQKGLAAADVRRLDAAMARMALLLCHRFNRPDTLMDTPGAGAAGGIGFGLLAAAPDARLVSGYDLVSAWLDLPARLAAADLVITGEGRFDATSLGGKGPGRLLAEARRLGRRCAVLAGSLGVAPATEPALAGVESCRAITPPDMELPEALRRAPDLLAAAVQAAF